MPHSSGGGSHGGGSHHSSHSSHSSRGGSGSSNKVGSKPFSGARRYYYYKNSRPVYVYANYDITKQPGKSRYLSLLFFIPFILFELMLVVVAFLPPSRLDVDYSDTHIYIEDNAYVLGGESTLRNECQTFFDKTGITPAIFTVYNDDWEEYYDSLEDYAYDLYVNCFDDEKHWLIVYSQDRYPGGWVDWYWEGMQGDDTDAVLNYNVTDAFDDNLQKYLLQNGKYSVGEAIAKAFGDANEMVMQPYTDWSLFVAAGFFLIYTVVCMYGVVHNPNKKYANAVQYKNAGEPVEYTCDYCGGIYIAGTCTTCPHCGAGVKPLGANG